MPAIVVVDGYNIKIHENGKVTIDEEDETGKDEQNPSIPPVSDVVLPGEIVTENNKEYTKNGTATIPVGFAIVPGLDDVEEGLVISDVANDTKNQGNQFVWIPVTDETPYERNKTYEVVDISTVAYDDTGYLPDGITDEKKAVRSVGGFYISRYEAGKEVINEKNTLVSKKGATVWTDITQESMKSTAKTMFTDNAHAKSALISGIQWDVTMNFITRTPARKDGNGENDYIVTEYDGSRHIGGDSVAVSGNNEADKVCNIYDLEGNAFEYVAERNTYEPTFPFVFRGGGYNLSYLVSHRGGASGAADSNDSFRLVLYVM